MTCVRELPLTSNQVEYFDKLAAEMIFKDFEAPVLIGATK